MLRPDLRPPESVAFPNSRFDEMHGLKVRHQVDAPIPSSLGLCAWHQPRAPILFDSKAVSSCSTVCQRQSVLAERSVSSNHGLANIMRGCVFLLERAKDGAISASGAPASPAARCRRRSHPSLDPVGLVTRMTRDARASV